MSNEADKPEHRFAAKARELREKNPALEIVLLRGGDGREEFDALVRPPTRAEWRHSKIMVDDPKTRNDANAWIVDQCLLWPDPKGDDFRALASRYPAWVDRISGRISVLAGADLELTAEKL